MTIDPIHPPLGPGEPWAPGTPQKTVGEMWDSGELPRPKTPSEELLEMLNEVPEGELPHYRLGRQYAVCVVRACAVAMHDQHDEAAEILTIADNLLGPLGKIGDPESLRDFIAGAARGIEIGVKETLAPFRW